MNKKQKHETIVFNYAVNHFIIIFEKQWTKNRSMRSYTMWCVHTNNNDDNVFRYDS